MSLRAACFAGCSWLSCLASAYAAQEAGVLKTPERSRAPFRALDNVEGAHVDPGIFPVRPLAWTSDGQSVYALNSFDSTVVQFDASYQSLATFRLPWGPVAIAIWDNPAISNDELGGEELLIVCRGSHVLARLDRLTGRTLGIVELASEPADILVIDSLMRAFVACAGVDQVLEIALDSGVVVRRHAIPSKHPYFLASDGTRVLVAPMLSGNNTTIEAGSEGFSAGPRGMLDLADPAVAVQGLSDHDLFRIDPATGAVSAVARATGTVLFAHAKNPVTGEHWQLNSDANNRDLQDGGEGEVFANVARNRVSFTTLPSSGPAAAPSRVRDLDDANPSEEGVQFDASRSVGQPFALAFDAAGHGFVLGLLSDNVTELDAAGAFVREWDVGATPRGIAMRPTRPHAVVYCMGTNEIVAFDVSVDPPAPLSAPRSLGFDPTAPLVRAGRRIFFSGAHSIGNNASCNTCHVDGGFDGLAWDLSQRPFDDKGPLTTRSLRGIADQLPFHWRGERPDLIDFNESFYAILGGLALTTGVGSDFEKFQAFVFSLDECANPLEDPERMVSAYQPTEFAPSPGLPARGSAVRGQDLFYDATTSESRSCESCHNLPSGTNNDVFNIEPDAAVRRSHYRVSPLVSLWRRTPAAIESVELLDGTIFARPSTGTGLVATGLSIDTLHFASQPDLDLSAQERVDVASFLEQIDTGLAPAVHRAALLAPSNAAASSAWLEGYLLRQARARNCDVAVFGDVVVGAQTRTLRWAWRRDTDLFECEDPAVLDQPLEFFKDQANQGTGRNVFLGLPVGMAERFAIDFDEDGLWNLEETGLGTDPLVADTDADRDPDGHEARNAGAPLDPNVTSNDTTPPVISNLRVIHTTTRVAKMQFETSEPTRWTLVYQAVGGAIQTAEDPAYRRSHTILLRDVTPQSSYSASLTAIDHGTLGAAQAFSFTTRASATPSDTWVESLSSTIAPVSPGVWRCTVTGLVRTKSGSWASGQELVVDVFVNKTFYQAGLRGSTSKADGSSVAMIEFSNLTSGDTVLFNIADVSDVGGAVNRWSMPDTPLVHRQTVVAVP